MDLMQTKLSGLTPILLKCNKEKLENYQDKIKQLLETIIRLRQLSL
jgi:hypothetical protein